MKNNLKEYCLKIDAPLLTEASLNYRPPSWPPPRDWPVVIDKYGKVISYWGDPIWDLTTWANIPAKLNFGDGKPGRATPIDRENADVLRLTIGWLIWGPRGYRNVGTITSRFSLIRKIFALCSENQINAVSLMRFPAIMARVPNVISPSTWELTIGLFHRLYDAREALGFVVMDSTLLQRLAVVASAHQHVQTPFIPPRIWVYQVERLRECIEDFLEKKSQIDACFRFCLNAYTANYGSLKASLIRGKDSTRGPFNADSLGQLGCTYDGPFGAAAARFGIADLLAKWIEGARESPRVSVFPAYLSLVSIAGLAYIANFTLQRKEEAAALRASCLLWEQDEKLGRIPIICGETTKTDFDVDARWVASPSVQIAVEALTLIARLRMICDVENPKIAPTPSDEADPYLFTTSTEPWGQGRFRPYSLNAPISDLQEVTKMYPKLFASDKLKITEEDLKIALRVTPNLPLNSFAVGEPWPLAWHQYRRTGAVNMFSSGMISDSSMQQQMKHSTRLMPLYYGRGHTRLRLNEEVEQTVVNAMYESMAYRLKDAVSDRFTSPNSADRKERIVVNLVSDNDVKTLTAWAKAGKVSFREHRLGGCMKIGYCEYGGIESVARCGGGDGGKPCTDVVYDRGKAIQVQAQLASIITEMSQLQKHHPRYAALAAERLAMENYLNVITT